MENFEQEPTCHLETGDSVELYQALCKVQELYSPVQVEFIIPFHMSNHCLRERLKCYPSRCNQGVGNGSL